MKILIQNLQMFKTTRGDDVPDESEQPREVKDNRQNCISVAGGDGYFN